MYFYFLFITHLSIIVYILGDKEQLEMNAVLDSTGPTKAEQIQWAEAAKPEERMHKAQTLNPELPFKPSSQNHEIKP